METGVHTVLAVDDDRISKYLTQIAFANSDVACELVFKAMAEEAIEYLKNSETGFPDVILLDIYMPGLSGWDFLDIYSKEDMFRGRSAAIILLSNTISPADRERARSYREVVGCIEKPVPAEYIREISLKYFR